MATLTLLAQSRYKDTPVYDESEGPVFALFEIPAEFQQITSEAKRHKIRKIDIGMLDKLAVFYYGEGNEGLWWVLALVNGILDQETDMVTGETLLIPPRDVMLAFLSRASNVS